MPRAMSDPGVRADLAARVRDPHVAPFADLVDELRAQHPGRTVPHVAPTSLGVEARLLVVHRSPAPAPAPAGPAGTTDGEPLLSVEGDDGGSERLHGLLTAAGIDPALVLPWNAVPWAVDPEQPLSAADAKAGRLVLARVVDLLPRLRVVVLHGREVEPVWDALAAAGTALPPGIRVEGTFSTEDAALAQHRASRLRRMAAVYASAADALR
ncbi:hypothetical protein [Quadrisphaera sp. INWT6]|uniref:hypothetical protein n=1 Tax=Quadrisphaera sp. INWT6 TaxID=2596917 RepID=UPI00189277CB|nr:hypothetical protein [Quadrisphaera sp. INWT6]MBF5082592.1 hypothetical protein [Quadrisphaera sp. INWT6]